MLHSSNVPRLLLLLSVLLLPALAGPPRTLAIRKFQN